MRSLLKSNTAWESTSLSPHSFVTGSGFGAGGGGGQVSRRVFDILRVYLPDSGGGGGFGGASWSEGDYLEGSMRFAEAQWKAAEEELKDKDAPFRARALGALVFLTLCKV